MRSLPTYDQYDEPTADLTVALPSSDPDVVEATLLLQPPGVRDVAPARPSSRGDQRGRSRVPDVLQLPAAGTLLRDRYRLEEIIGRGGTSVVYRATDLKGGSQGERKIAVKLLKPELHARPSAVERLKREYQLGQALAHPGIVRVYDLDRNDCDGVEQWFMALELLEGRTLAALLRSSERPMDVPMARQFVAACGEALAFAHERGVVHGDFKPANVFITHDNEIRVLDFGNATNAAAGVDPAERAATACYASPEVLLGMRPESRDDVFSFACVAYELFNSRHPYDRKSSLDARKAKLMPPRAWTLLERQWLPLEAALSFTRERRPQLRTLLTDLLAADSTTIDIPIAARRATVKAKPHRDVPVVVHPIIRPSPIEARIRAPKRERMSPQPVHPFWRFFVGLIVTAILGLAIYMTATQWQRYPALHQDLQNWMQGESDIAPAADTNPPLPASPAPVPGDIPIVDAPPVAPQVIAPAQATNPARTPAAATNPPAAARRTSSDVRTSTSPARRDTSAVRAGAPSTVTLNEGTVAVGELTYAAAVRVSRERSLTGRTSVLWRAVSGTARAGQDFAIASGIVEFPEGHETRTLYVPLMNDDVREPDEQFTVELYQPAANTTLGGMTKVTVTIRDDD